MEAFAWVELPQLRFWVKISSQEGFCSCAGSAAAAARAHAGRTCCQFVRPVSLRPVPGCARTRRAPIVCAERASRSATYRFGRVTPERAGGDAHPDAERAFWPCQGAWWGDWLNQLLCWPSPSFRQHTPNAHNMPIALLDGEKSRPYAILARADSEPSSVSSTKYKPNLLIFLTI